MSKKQIELTRRRVLGGLGTIGVAGAAAGLGTSAYLSDTESFEDNVMTAGELDLLVDYYSYWNQGSAGTGEVSGTADGEAVSSELGDVKPGDSGIVAFCPRIETNPAYLWLCGELTDSSENGYTEPEPEDDNGEGELEENIEVDVKYCELDDDIGDDFDPDDVDEVATIWSGTLAEFLAMAQTGLPLDGDADGPDDDNDDNNDNDDTVGFYEPGEQECFVGTDSDEENYCICLDWEVPTSVGNEIQGDSLEFDVQFYAQQCRHNDGTDNPCGITTETGDDFAKQTQEFNGDGTSSAGARARYGNNGSSGAWELAVGDEPGVSGEFAQENHVWTSGDTVDYSVEYDESSDELTFTFDGTTISDTIDDPQPDGRMAIQGKADEANVEASIDSLSIDGDSVSLSGPTSVTATNDGDGRQVRHLVVNTALDGSTSFELSGEATVTLQDDYAGGQEGVAFDVVFE
ncbi:choice-of-anchor W domain-containing protein [Halobacterium yunchengense]|uniref:choice-of-anchor W domain-containing protein n=1 Tax=Halobacterium yunchengense TaxID=3108497 RepID=UPI0030094C32